MKKNSDICNYKKSEMEEILKERLLKWRIQETVEEGLLHKKAVVAVPANLLSALEDITDQSGKASIKDLQA